MDARPQRPLRSMRTFNNENAVPELPLPKTIHQRNKSSPVLSNLAAGAALKAAAKRTAFGDVSNIVSGPRAGKDDASISTKTGLYTSGKVGHTLQERKSAAFLRPAHRPLSVSSSLRNLLAGSGANTAPINHQTKPSNTESVPVQSVTNTRKTLAKRATTIFKDVALKPVQEHEDVEPQKSSPAAPPVQQFENISTDVTIPTPDSQLYLPPPSVPTTIEPVKEDNPIPEPLEPFELLSSHLDVSVALPPSEPAPEVTLDVTHVEQIPHSLAPYASEVATEEAQTYTESTHSADQYCVAPVEHVQQAHSQPLAPIQTNVMPEPPRPEPEEYWEEEEEGYEEDAYVTARSFRSKGENTTGGATTILAPRMNQKARREIEEAKKIVEATRTAEDIEDEAYDTSMVAEYGDEIFEYMRQLETKMTPNPHYMDNQHEIQWSMRSVLMDWLVQVHHRFNLLPETLFLCVNYIDRFLSSKVVSLGKLQLVGATAIFIAAKYEEINCPAIQEIVYMVDGGYTVDEILKAERFMLTMLQFELGWPGPMSFLRRISKADDYDLETRTLAKYFLEVTLMDERFIGSPPSFTAAASQCLARMMLRKGSWSAHHVYYSGYTYAQLKPLVQLLLDCCEEPRKHHSAVYNKYCDKRYKRASAFVENEVQRGFFLPHSPTAPTTMTQPEYYAYYDNNQYIDAVY